MEQKTNWAALWSIKGMGFKSFWTCQKYLKKDRNKWQRFWVGDKSVYAECGLKEKLATEIQNFISEHKVCEYVTKLKKRDISVITINEKFYPELLKKIDDPPPVIFSRGDVSLLNSVLMIAVVGTRQITSYGEMACKKIVSDLMAHGATIVSGFMYGVDVCAQSEALSGGGKTVGVLGFGFDHMYPASQFELFKDFLKRGACFISEFPPFVRPNVINFPRRNRLVAGMSQAVVVVEAAEKSGSHITAQAALDYGRTVAAVPGPISNQYSLGTKKLINQGAVLINSGIDLLLELNWYDQVKAQVCQDERVLLTKNLMLQLTETQRKVIKLICDQAATENELMKSSGLSLPDLNYVLTELQLLDCAEKKSGKWQPTKLVF